MATDLDAYSYAVPDELIAAAPAEPRDASRLLAHSVKDDVVTDAVFLDLAAHAPAGALFVFNTTKVVPARAMLARETVTDAGGRVTGGGKVELLFLVNEFSLTDTAGPTGPKAATISAMSDRKIALGETLCFASGHALRAVGQDKNVFTFELDFPAGELFAVLDQNGTTPLPAYIKETPLAEDEARERYQSMFAAEPASAAAPTASLHFTERVIESLRAKGCEIAFVTLHVGLGTFAPVGEKELASGTLHAEPYSIPVETAAAIRVAKAAGRPVIAVGSTVARTLETAAGALLDRDRDRAGATAPSALSGITTIFIRPGFAFRIVDGLVTNFHVPRSSLMLFVDAFLRHKGARRGIMSLYAHAIEKRYRLFSFGDAMLVL